MDKFWHTGKPDDDDVLYLVTVMNKYGSRYILDELLAFDAETGSWFDYDDNMRGEVIAWIPVKIKPYNGSC